MTDISAPSIVDVASVLVVFYGAVRGSLRGLSGELSRLIGIVGALACGLCFHGPLATWFSEHTRLTGRAAAALAFVLSVLAAAGCMIGLRLLVKRVMHVVVEPGVDKFLGCFAGLLRAGVLVVIVFLSMNLLPHDYLNRLFGADSIIGAAVLRFAPMGPPGEIPPLEDGQPGEMPRANERKR